MNKLKAEIYLGESLIGTADLEVSEEIQKRFNAYPKLVELAKDIWVSSFEGDMFLDRATKLLKELGEI